MSHAPFAFHTSLPQPAFLRLLLLLSVVALSSCAAPSAYDIGPKVSIGSLGSSAVVIIDDRRPEADKRHSYGSFLIGAKDYGIWTLGDESFTPPMMEAVRLSAMHAAARRNPAPQRIELVVERLIVQDNQQAAHLSEGGAGLGPLGVMIAEAMHGQSFERDFQKTRPFVIAFFRGKVTVDGHTRDVAVVKATNYRHPVADVEGRRVATTRTMEAFLDALGEEIARP